MADVRILVCCHGLRQETAAGSTRQSHGSDIAAGFGYMSAT